MSSRSSDSTAKDTLGGMLTSGVVSGVGIGEAVTGASGAAGKSLKDM